jgi:hypothetical protein
MTMRFGKFKGWPIEDLPDDYLRWLRGLEDLREPLRSAVHAEWAARQGHSGLAPLAVDVRPVAEELVTAGLRQLTQRHHPDCGGSTQVMQQVNQAAEWLRAAVRGAA